MVGIPAPPPNPFSTDALSPEDAARYLTRIGLDSEAYLSGKPSLSQLSALQLAHLEHVPKDTSPLHVPADHWSSSTDPDTPIQLASAPYGMPEGSTRAAFDRIVQEHKGAFCFVANAVFATLLRTLGYRVSECATRCYKYLGQDPRVHAQGYLWGTLTHEILLVDWQEEQDSAGGSESKDRSQRYLVDVMWGPNNLAKPIPLQHGAQINGLNEYEAYQLLHEDLPLSPGAPRPIDSIRGWTLYRRINKRGVPATLPIPQRDDNKATSIPASKTEDGSGGAPYWSPMFHFLPIHLPRQDFSMLHLYSSVHTYASFSRFWLVTKLIPGGQGARRSMMYSEREDDVPGQERAKVYTTGGIESEGLDEGRDVEWVPMRVGPMRKWFQDNMGYKFD